MKYRKKPVAVEAVRWTGDNFAELDAFAGTQFGTIHPDDRGDDPDNDAQVYDKLHSVWVPFSAGDWVIRGVQGELYPCKAEVFEATYDVDDTPDPSTSRVRIHLPGPTGDSGSVEVEGVDIAPALRGLSLNASVGNQASLTLQLAMRGVEVEGVQRLYLSSAQVGLLARFGWAPPAHAEMNENGGVLLTRVTD